MKFEKTLLSLALASLSIASAPLVHAEHTSLAPVVVTGEAMDEPVTVHADPKAPRQPIPTHDGADYLKTIPGFSVTRKGGSDGDPQFRGMSGSRLGILVDGENLLGGCNSRMDAPTAYIYPELYDALTVIKGPQTVVHGPGMSAATILFERKVERFDEPGARLHTSALAASADRFDMLADVQAGNKLGYLQLTGSDSRANDYRDGNGDKVHSEYHRYSGNLALGLTPDENTKAELSATRSDGEAAYADRGMDGSKFLRDSLNLRLERRKISPLVEEVSLHAFQNSVDHVMDDQTLRTPGMMGYSNPKRETAGGRIATTLNLGEDAHLTLGSDTQDNAHKARSARPGQPYSAWRDDANFNQLGLFAEGDYLLGEHDRLIAGYRADRWEVTDERAMISTGMMSMVMNPTANQTRNDTLHSGFLRLEHDLHDQPATLYAGIGRVERFPDYWEMIARQGDGSVSAFGTRNEVTDQLDLGALYKDDKLEGGLSLFYSKIDDYILIDYTRMGVRGGAARNIDATSYGAELTSAYALTEQWKIDGALSWTWGSNDTDHAPLAQLPPLEGRLGLTWTRDQWTTGALLRAVDDQDRYDAGRGTIVGQDFAPGGGFSVFSVNAAWNMDEHTQLSAGIDNAFDKTYAEFVSRAGGNGMGGAIPGYEQTSRVNEPGRTVWARMQWQM